MLAAGTGLIFFYFRGIFLTLTGLVGCFFFFFFFFLFNGHLRQYFSLYRAVFKREGEKEK